MSNINVNNLTPLLGSGSSVSVSGSLVVKNDVTIGGHLYIGDQDTDSVTFSAEVSSSVIPDANVTYDLGSSAKKWSQIFLNSLVTHHITASGNISASGTGTNGTGSFHHVATNGNITSSGTGSFEGGVIANNATGSFGYVSCSTDISASGDVFGTTGSFIGGIDAGQAGGTGSFGYISASSDISTSGDIFGTTGSFFGGVSCSEDSTGSFGQITAVGDISSSTSGSFMDLFVDDMVEVQGDINLHGNISSSNTSTGSFGYVSASGDVSAAGVLYTTTGVISIGDISSSAGLVANNAQFQNNGVNTLSVTTAGALSASSTLAGTALTLATNGVNALTVAANGNLSSSGTLAGTTLTLGDTGVNVATIDELGNVSGSGTGSFVSLNVTDDGVAKFNVDTNGHVSASGNISSSADILGARFALSVEGVQHFEVDSIGNVSGSGTGSFVSLNITEDGVKKFNVDTNGHVSASGNISSSAGLLGTTFTAATNGATKATIDASGNIAAEGAISGGGALSGTSLELASDGTSVAAISSTGTGSFHGGIDCIGDGKNATGSFGYISASEDVSSSGTVFGENIIAGAGNSIIKGNIKFEGAVLRPIKSITADTVLGATAGVLEDSGKTIVLNKADGATVTLPAAAGTGASYHFFVGTAISSNSYIIRVADATDTIAGAVHMIDADDDSQTTITAKGTDDTVTLNGGTTSGGALGETLTFTDIATNKYTVQGNLIVPAGSDPADPFSATV